MGKPIIMGRKTWDSLTLRPLPGRPNLIVTTDAHFSAPKARVFGGLDAALAAAQAIASNCNQDEICVIGGAALYEALIEQADRLYLTEVDASPDGDVYFPEFDETHFVEAERREYAKGVGDDYSYVLRRLDRIVRP